MSIFTERPSAPSINEQNERIRQAADRQKAREQASARGETPNSEKYNIIDAPAPIVDPPEMGSRILQWHESAPANATADASSDEAETFDAEGDVETEAPLSDDDASEIQYSTSTDSKHPAFESALHEQLAAWTAESEA
jgi:hypothetical protein